MPLLGKPTPPWPPRVIFSYGERPDYFCKDHPQLGWMREEEWTGFDAGPNVGHFWSDNWHPKQRGGLNPGSRTADYIQRPRRSNLRFWIEKHVVSFPKPEPPITTLTISLESIGIRMASIMVEEDRSWIYATGPADGVEDYLRNKVWAEIKNLMEEA